MTGSGPDSSDWLNLALGLMVLAMQWPDIWTTNRILARGGREKNPLVRLIMRRLGRRWWLAKLAVALAGVAALVRLGGAQATWALSLTLAVYCLVVWHNLRQLTRKGR